MKNILITGGAGFIGSNLGEYLFQKGYNVIVVDNLSIGKKENLTNKKIKFYKKNLSEIDNLNFKKNIDIIIHLSAKAEILISKKKKKFTLNQI